MSTSNLLLSFAFLVGDSASTSSQGPCFHRWIPNGPNEAIVLEPNPKVTIRIWFEAGECRKGELSNDHIPLEAIKEYGQVVAGPVRGSLELRGRSDEEMKCVKEMVLGHPSYLRLGKLIIQDFLCERLSRFIQILRINYGQYWIHELPVWDSRTYSLGAYCVNVLNMKCSTDGGTSWLPFQPTEKSTTIHTNVFVAQGLEYAKYLTGADWRAINKALADAYEPSVAARFLARAHELFESGNGRHAFIEAVTGLELAIGELSRKKLSRGLRAGLASFENLPLKNQLAVVAAFSGLLTDEEVAAGVRVIDIRHKIVHEGANIPEDARADFYNFLGAVGRILLVPGFKFPSAGGNCRMSQEQWEKLESGVPREG